MDMENNNNIENNYWKPGDALTKADMDILAPLINRARMLGYTPTKAEVPGSVKIKRRFRTWGNAVKAAGLPWVNYPSQARLRTVSQRQDARWDDSDEKKQK
jgi:hypothetical protein